MDDAIAHIRHLRDYYQISNFHIYDDILYANRGFFTKFLDEVVRQNLNVKLYFVNGLRFDTFHKDDILAKKEAVVYVAGAIGTASSRLQKKIKKFVLIERALENITLTDAAGIFSNGFHDAWVSDGNSSGNGRDCQMCGRITASLCVFFYLEPLFRERKLLGRSGFD